MNTSDSEKLDLILQQLAWVRSMQIHTLKHICGMTADYMVLRANVNAVLMNQGVPAAQIEKEIEHVLSIEVQKSGERIRDVMRQLSQYVDDWTPPPNDPWWDQAGPEQKSG